jgi:hypothetical protein
MALLGQGVAAIWHEVEPAGEDDYHHWHCHEHIPERVSIEGFLRGRRYVAVTGAPRFFHFYETESLATLTSAAYLERLNDPTPWTQRVLPYFSGTNRTLAEVVLSHGLGQGAAILTLRLRAADPAALRQWLDQDLFPRIVQGPWVVGAHLLRGDEAASRTETSEKAIRKGRDEVAEQVIFIEAIEADALCALREDALGDADLQAHGGSAAAAGVYRLHFTLTAAECHQPQA